MLAGAVSVSEALQPQRSNHVATLEIQGNGNNYVLLDSNDVGGPSFDTPAFRPATLAASVSAGVDSYETVELGFTFVYQGVPQTAVGVADNGYLAFNVSTGDNAHVPPADPSLVMAAEPIKAVIMPFWYDMAPAVAGEIYYDTFGNPGSRVFVVEYRGVASSTPHDSGATFQVRLFETSNAIEFHYMDVTFGNAGDLGAEATVGLRANGGPGPRFLQYSSNDGVIHEGLAIRLWRPTCGDKLAMRVGTRGNDQYLGFVTRDVYYGHTGNDMVRGNGGTDFLCGGPGSDTLIGGSAEDNIFGGSGRDRLIGLNGVDLLVGGAGRDVMRGGAGHDLLRGLAGEDRMYGQGGNDRLIGGGGSDRHHGGPGVDICVGGTSPQNRPDSYHGCETQR